MSGKQMSMDQFAELAAAVTRCLPRDLPPEKAQTWILGQKDLAQIIREALFGRLGSSFQSFFFACCQDRFSLHFTEENFPLVDDGTGELPIIEYGFDRTVKGIEAEKELQRLGYKPIGIKRTRDYIAAHLDAQKEHPLIVLGAQRNFGVGSGGFRMPYFAWSENQRHCSLGCLLNDFGPDCRFLVVVDQTKNLFQNLLTTCLQHWVNEEITVEHFPLVDDGTSDKEIIECGFDNILTGFEAENKLKSRGYKLVGMRRALEYIASHPDAQKDHPLIVLGAQWHNSGCIRLPVFYWGYDKLFLNLRWMSDEFNPDCRFLVVQS